MRTCLNYGTKHLIKQLNSQNKFYEIIPKENNLQINKKHTNKRGRPFSMNLSKDIIISPETIGLIVGEGFIGDRHFVFANSNEKAVKEVMHFLKQFNLPVKCYLELSIKGQPKKFINTSKKFWEKHLKIKLSKLRLRKEFYNLTKNGTIHLILNNSLVAKLLKKIIKDSKKEIEIKKDLSKRYLKGILAAEGNINVKRKTNCVYMVRISASKQEERNHYKKCLERVGISLSCKDMPTISKQEARIRGWKTTKGRAGCVIISRWENFVKILELGLLDLSSEKKEKFIKHFLNNKFTKQFLSFRHFIGKKFLMKDAQEYFNLTGRNLNRVMSLKKEGYLKRKRLDNKRFEYKLTKKYIKLYNKIIQEANLFQITPFFNS
jgi:hypothetical protein